MKKLTLLILIVVYTLSGQANSIIKEFNSKIKIFSTFTGGFTQAIYDEYSNLVEKSMGETKISKPSSIIWQTDSPEKQVMIKNTEKLWIYDVDLEQVTIHQVDSVTQLNALSLILDDNFDYVSHFNITAKTNRGNRIFSFKSITEEFPFERLIITFNAKNKLLNLTIIDYIGAKTHIEFNNVKYNQKIEEDIFTFTPPKGVDVIVH